MEQKWRSPGGCLASSECPWQKEDHNPNKTPKPDIYLNLMRCLDVTELSVGTEGHAKWHHGNANSKTKFCLFSLPSSLPTSSLPHFLSFSGGYMCMCVWVYVYTCGASVWACVFPCCAGMWAMCLEPEVDIWFPLLSASILFHETGSLTEASPHWLTKLTGQEALGILLSPSPKCYGYRHRLA